ncbi:uncharacterized protein TNCV_347191 [Trichonephila clavipes]|nr:uncharacterized protein TNCV_347191 [Trichonephila clavipes]
MTGVPMIPTSGVEPVILGLQIGYAISKPPEPMFMETIVCYLTATVRWKRNFKIGRMSLTDIPRYQEGGTDWATQKSPPGYKRPAGHSLSIAVLEQDEEDYFYLLSHTPGLALHSTVAGKCPSSPEDEQEKQGESRDMYRKTLLPAQKSYYADVASAVCQDPDTVLIRVESMIESTTNINEFRSKDGTVVRVPDADFNIIPRSVTKNTTPCSTRIRTTTICVSNQGLIGDASWPWKILWSDEAHFHLSGTVNTHNCRIWDTENPRTFQEIPLHSPKVTVWCGLTATFILGPFFFEETTRNGPVTCTVMARRYKNMLENFVAPQMLQHQCLDTITFIRAFPTAWPPRSPDLNPCNFWLWGYLKYLVYRGRLITLADLKDSITLHVRNISIDQLRSAVEQTLHRLQILHLEEGNHIEQHSMHR